MKGLKNIITGFVLRALLVYFRATKSIKGFFVCGIGDSGRSRLLKKAALAVLSFALPFVFAFFLGCYDGRPDKATNGRPGTCIQPPISKAP